MATRLIFLPGLGCDRRMVDAHRAIANADVDIIEWIEPLGEGESFADYSQRMADVIQRQEGQPFYLAGVSLGGMSAIEIARDVKVRGLILIAACRSNRGIPVYSRWAARIAGRSPLWLIRLGRWSLPHMRRFFGIMTQPQVELFAAMLGDASPRFIRWCLRACADWPGPTALPDVPTLHIHGRHDHVLPMRLAGKVDAVIEGAGHAVNVTHAHEVNAVIERWLAEQDKGDLLTPPSSNPQLPAP